MVEFDEFLNRLFTEIGEDVYLRCVHYILFWLLLRLLLRLYLNIIIDGGSVQLILVVIIIFKWTERLVKVKLLQEFFVKFLGLLALLKQIKVRICLWILLLLLLDSWAGVFLSFINWLSSFLDCWGLSLWFGRGRWSMLIDIFKLLDVYLYWVDDDLFIADLKLLLVFLGDEALILGLIILIYKALLARIQFIPFVSVFILFWGLFFFYDQI